MQKNQKNTRAKKSGHVESDGEKSEYANQKMPLQKSKKWAKIDCKGKKKTLLTVMFEILTQMC